MKKTFAAVVLLAALGVFCKLALKAPPRPDDAPGGAAPQAAPRDAGRDLLAKYPAGKDRDLVERTLGRYAGTAVNVEQSYGLRGLALLDRLDLEAIYLYEKHPAEFRKLGASLTDDAAADLLLHWSEYFGLKRADDTDRSILVEEIARLSADQRRWASKYPNALPLILADPPGVTALIRRLDDSPEDLADALVVLDELRGVRGIADLGVASSLGQPTVRIDVNRAAAARYGLTPDDVNQTVAAAIGGSSPGDLYEASTDRHFPIVVRLQPGERDSLSAIRRITVGAPSPTGDGEVQVPLAEVASIRLTSGASFIYREHQERYVPIKFSVRDRDLGGAVDEAQERIAKAIPLPPGYHLEWAGELGNLTSAISRLEVVVPISLALILFLLYANFSSVTDTLLAFSVIPMAIVGGVLALALTGTPFSISAAIGFVALFGIAVMDGILMVTTFNQALDEGETRSGAIATVVRVTLRPVVMTCLAAAIGLLPAALSTGIGSQVQKPLALVVVGGMTLAPVIILLVLPVLIVRFSRHVGPRDRGAHGRDVGHHPHGQPPHGEQPHGEPA